MVRPPEVLVVVAAALGTSTWSARAHAEETAPWVAAPEAQPLRHFVFGQALAILVRRIAVGYELLPAPHHSFGITIHGQWPTTRLLSPAHGTVTGLGGEVGYRYYASEVGPTGPFFAVSFLSGHYHSRASLLETDPSARWFTQYGWAIDMGWSVALEKTTILAIALGMQRTWIDVPRADITDSAQLTNGEGVRPRAQLQVGRVF